MKYLKRIKTAYICAGVLFSIMGLILIIFPQISMRAICCIIGVFAIMLGTIKICAYFSDDRYNIAFQFDLALGILAIIIGIIFIAKTSWVLSFFSTITGIIITASSLFSVQASIDSKKFGLKAWGALLAVSVISMASGYYDGLATGSFDIKTKNIIFFAYTALPGILALLSIIPMFKYDIVGDKKKEITKALAEKRN